jgi:hypothetical protein
VVFVANLGNREWPLGPNTYWVRYKAKNSYGAYVQGNMLCKKAGDKWVRDRANELIVQMAVTTQLIERQTDRLRKGLEMDTAYQSRYRKVEDVAYEQALAITDEGHGSLAEYASKAK